MDSERLTSRNRLAPILAVILATSLLLLPSRGCHFPAIYNFGDSNSDTGSVSAAFGRIPPPNGENYFGKPSGRHSDGRLIIDFIAEELGLPLLNAYLDSIESNFSHGANFAASGSTAQPANAKLFGAGFNPLSLNIQLLQFEQLKERTKELNKEAKSSSTENTLPRLNEYAKALYTLDIGQNDLTFGLMSMSEKQVLENIPNIIEQLALSIEKLYQEGGRTFWIHNTGPIGCLPLLAVRDPPKPENADENGCVKSYNEVAREFNKQLKEKVSKLRSKLQVAVLIYVDIYSAKYNLITEAKKHGFVGPLEYCCGDLGENSVPCWETRTVNGTTKVYAESCSDPSKYISWDGAHYTEAANRWILNYIADGSFSDPPISLAKACHMSKLFK